MVARKERSVMALRWFPVNDAYAFIFGSDINTAQVLRMSGEPLFFADRKSAVAAAKRHNLTVGKSGNVVLANV